MERTKSVLKGVIDMRSVFLPFAPPAISQEEISEVLDTLSSDWITTGPKVKEFENNLPDI